MDNRIKHLPEGYAVVYDGNYLMHWGSLPCIATFPSMEEAQTTLDAAIMAGLA